MRPRARNLCAPDGEPGYNPNGDARRRLGAAYRMVVEFSVHERPDARSEAIRLLRLIADHNDIANLIAALEETA